MRLSFSRKAEQHQTKGFSRHTSRRTNIWLALTLVAVSFLVVVTAGMMWYRQNTSALDPKATATVFTINEGDTADEIIARLYDGGFIRSELAFKVALRLSGEAANNIKAGRYSISASEDVAAILAVLESGQAADVALISFIPGETLQDIRGSLVKAGYSEAAVDAALERTYDHPLLQDKPPKASLEGYIYPDTYEINIAEDPSVVIQKSFDSFYQKLKSSNLLDGAFAPSNLNLYEAITLGSIIEKEVNTVIDRPIVAQIFLSRLKIDMMLGSDATFVYAAEQLGVAPSTTLDSPYNTRVVAGLPPGPISNMTVDALEAIAEPSKTNYLYFVTGDDNVTHYGRTIEEHERNVADYCGVRCEL